MKKMIIVVVGLGIALPTVVFAQETTRAEVRQELVDLESVGYKPSGNFLYYPDNIVAAENRLAQLKAQHQKEGSDTVTVRRIGANP